MPELQNLRIQKAEAAELKKYLLSLEDPKLKIIEMIVGNILSDLGDEFSRSLDKIKWKAVLEVWEGK